MTRELIYKMMREGLPVLPYDPSKDGQQAQPIQTHQAPEVIL